MKHLLLIWGNHVQLMTRQSLQGLTRQLQRKKTKYLGKFSLYCNSKNRTKKLRVGVFTLTKGNAYNGHWKPWYSPWRICAHFSCVAQLLYWNGCCNVCHGLLLLRNQFWLVPGPHKSSDKVVKRIETQNVWWPVVPQWRLTGDDPSTKLFDEKVDVEVSCVRCCSVLHEPVISAPGLVLDLWPDMLLQHLLILLWGNGVGHTILIHHPPHRQHSPINHPAPRHHFWISLPHTLNLLMGVLPVGKLLYMSLTNLNRGCEGP